MLAWQAVGSLKDKLKGVWRVDIGLRDLVCDLRALKAYNDDDDDRNFGYYAESPLSHSLFLFF